MLTRSQNQLLSSPSLTTSNSSSSWKTSSLYRKDIFSNSYFFISRVSSSLRFKLNQDSKFRHLSTSSKDADISQEDYQKAAIKVDNAAREYLKSLGITNQNLPTSVNRDIPATYSKITPNLFAWQQVLSSPYKMEDGKFCILNSDKEILIKAIAALVDKNKIAFRNKISLVNEGCDNGDFLSLIIPYLISSGGISKESINILLINGHVQKLKIAAGLASKLLSSSNTVSILQLNAFDGIPAELAKYSEHQKLFLLFRLVIVEKPNQIKSLLSDRLKYMSEKDVAVASFLLADEHADAAMKDYHFKIDSSTEEELVFKKSFSSGIQKVYQLSGGEAGFSDIYNSAFSIRAVRKMVENSNGEILSLQLIPSTTDEGSKINIIGVIFKKKFFS